MLIAKSLSAPALVSEETSTLASANAAFGPKTKISSWSTAAMSAHPQGWVSLIPGGEARRDDSFSA